MTAGNGEQDVCPWWETWPGTVALRGAGLAQREEFLSPLYGYILDAVHKLV